MRTTAKIVLVIIIITLVYSVVKLISASVPQEQTIATITWPIEQANQTRQNTSNSQAPQMQNATAKPAPVNQNTTSQNNEIQTKTVYQADEILIDGQGQAGQNYIDITSDTPITPQQQNTNNTQSSGGAYAQASVNVVNNKASTSAQTYAPGMPASEVLYGN